MESDHWSARWRGRRPPDWPKANPPQIVQLVNSIELFFYFVSVWIQSA